MDRKNLPIIFLILCLSLSGSAFRDEGLFPELKGHKNTMNFRVWAPAKEDAAAIAGELEAYYKRFLRDLKYGGMLKKKPEIYVFRNYQEYLDKTGTLGYNTFATGGIAIPRSARKPAKIYSFLSDNLLSEVLPHELTHLLFKEITAGLRTDASIPLWLNEGMATYEETGRRYEGYVNAARARGGLIPIAELVNYTNYPSAQDKRALFYAQSVSLVGFLLKNHGGSKFLAFSKKLVRGGKNIDEALFSAYYPQIRDVSELSAEWSEYIEGTSH